MMQIKKYSKLKMFGLYALSLFVNLLPLMIVLFLNWEVCTKTKRESVALTTTGFVWVMFLIFSMIGAMPKRASRVVTLIVVFVLLEMMKPLLSQMCLFAGASAIGALLDVIIVRPIIKKYLELRVATTTADLTTLQVKTVVEEALKEAGCGRV